MSYAFKEWHVIVEALGAGEQSLILRKGGIAEGRGGFQRKAEKLWLFPTRFHEQLEKTKPAAEKFFGRLPPDTPHVELRYFAEVVRHAFLTDWAVIARLDAFHFWSEDTIRERFNRSKPPGVHVLAVRVHRLKEPVSLDVTPEMAGCKSWLELPLDFSAQPSEPVIDQAAFSHRLAELDF